MLIDPKESASVAAATAAAALPCRAKLRLGDVFVQQCLARQPRPSATPVTGKTRQVDLGALGNDRQETGASAPAACDALPQPVIVRIRNNPAADTPAQPRKGKNHV